MCCGHDIDAPCPTSQKNLDRRPEISDAKGMGHAISRTQWKDPH